MKTKIAKRALMLALTALLLLGLAPSALAAPDYEEFVEVKIPVKQAFFSYTPGKDESCLYVFSAVTEDAPMPFGSDDGRYSFRLYGDDERTITFTATEAGHYEHRLAQHVQDRDGYTYDRTVYRVEVDVWMGGERPTALVVIRGKGGAKVSDVVFENSYEGGRLPIWPTPPPQDGGAIETGDETSFAGWFALMGGSLAGMVLVLLWLRRKDNGEKGDAIHEK